MNHFVILIGLPLKSDLGDQAEKERSRRMYSILHGIFSLGPAWTGNQGSVLLKTEVSCEEVRDRIAQFVEGSDLIVVMEISPTAVVAIGWIADEDGFDAIYPDAVKFGVLASGETYRIE